MAAEASLAERAVACKHFRWMPGMRAVSTLTCLDEGHHEPGRVVAVNRYRWGAFVEIFDDDGDARSVNADTVRPDLDDPATLGCIEHGLLPEAWGVCTVELEVDYMVSTDGWWAEIEISPADTSKGFVLEVRAETRLRALAEVLIAALEAAPDMRNRCAGMLVREVR